MRWNHWHVSGLVPSLSYFIQGSGRFAFGTSAGGHKARPYKTTHHTGAPGLFKLLTTFSDSSAVKPTPVYAERAWGLADFRAIQVWVRATDAMRVTKMERGNTTNSEMIDIICPY